MSISVDEIQEYVVDICKKEYGDLSEDRYFIAKNTSEEHVRSFLLDKLREENEDFGKMKYLNMAAYVLQVGDDVFIDII